MRGPTVDTRLEAIAGRPSMQWGPSVAGSTSVDPPDPAGWVDGTTHIVAGYPTTFGTIGLISPTSDLWCKISYNNRIFGLVGDGTAWRPTMAVNAEAERFVVAILRRDPTSGKYSLTTNLGSLRGQAEYGVIPHPIRGIRIGTGPYPAQYGALYPKVLTDSQTDEVIRHLTRQLQT